jgi:hypothetical protein
MFNKTMVDSIAHLKPLNRWDYSSIRPGPQGSVGDVLGSIKLKHSFPDQGIRLEPAYKGNKQNRLGSNVSDGNSRSFTTAGPGDPYVSASPWNAYRNQQYNAGWTIQDVRAPDTLHTPFTGSTPEYSWQNKIATVYNAQRTGKLFLPLPGAYQLSPGETPRGGREPEVTDITGTTLDAATVNQLFQTPTLGRRQLRTGIHR